MPVRADLGILLKEDVEAMLGKLPAREALVLKERFGLEDGQPKTLRHLGTVLKVTPERIRQLESRALGRLMAMKREEA